MRDDVLVLLVTSIAISVPQDEVAFEMLHVDFIKDFRKFYNESVAERRAQGQTSAPIVLDEMIKFTINTLSEKCTDAKSLFVLRSEPVMTEIKRRFMTDSLPEMVTTLAKRDLVKRIIRTFMHGKDRHNNHAQIDSTRFDGIFADFIQSFWENSSGTFRFDGSFTEFMCHCFAHFHYVNKKRDIWRDLRAVDHAKREAETSIGAVKVLEETRTDNVRVGDFFRNIVKLNDRMFYHSGQSLEVKGVCYDVYYLILNFLCKERVNSLNNALEESNVNDYRVMFIDELDRRESRTVTKYVNGVPTQMRMDANKSIHSKINNAWELVPYLFKCIRDGGWSFDNFIELRDQCFLLGKKDMEGKNCIWRNVYKGAETTRYFDVPQASHNYTAFDLLFKGVLSVFSLMKALEERGRYLVDTYPVVSMVIESRDIARSIEYLDDLDYVHRMKQLIDKAAEYPRQVGDVKQYTEMVHEYAGSDQNNHADIREYRYEALVQGLLDAPRLKQKGAFQTEYEKLKSVAEYMTSLPRSYDEYVYRVFANNALTFCFASPGRFTPDYVLVQRYSTPYYNRFFTSNPELANYYLYEIGDHGRGPNDPPPPALDPMEWHVCKNMTPYVHITELVTALGDITQITSYGLFVPMASEFVVIPMGAPLGAKLNSLSMSELQQAVIGDYYNGRQNTYLQTQYAQIPPEVYSAMLLETRDGRVPVETAINNSIGFDSLMGLCGLEAPSVALKLSKIKVDDQYVPILRTYHEWLCDLTKLQNSLVEILNMMLTYSIYTTRSVRVGAMSGDEGQGLILFHSLLKSEFREENLNWFFARMQEEDQRGHLQKIDYTWGTNPPAQGIVNFVGVDLSIMDIFYGQRPKDMKPHGLMEHFCDGVDTMDTLPKKFVYAYNYLACTLTFMRVLRDAFDLTLNVIGGNVVTLGCELDSRFHIREVLESARGGMGTGGMLDIKCALIDSMSIEAVMRSVSTVRAHNWQVHCQLCEGLIRYVDGCHNAISSLVDYDVNLVSETKSQFSQFGGMFEAAGPYTHPVVMTSLGVPRARARRDDAGFLLLKNIYFHAQIGSVTYYVHSTGRVLAVSKDDTRPMTFNFDDPTDAKLYGDIISDAKRRCSWQKDNG